MSPSAAHGRIGRSALVVLQLVVFVTYLFGPTAALGQDPTPEPTATESPAAEPTADPAPSTEPEPSPSTEAEPSIEAEPAPSALSSEPAPAEPTISTGKDDYVPTEWVDIYGSGWNPGEVVDILVDDHKDKTWSHTAAATADVNGALVYEFPLPSWFVATYTVTASGDSGRVVTTTFADSIALGNLSTNSNSGNGTASQQLTLSVPAIGAGEVAIAQVVVNKDFKDRLICPPAGWTSILKTFRGSNLANAVFVQESFIRTTVAPAQSQSWQFRAGNCSTGALQNGFGASGGVITYSGVEVASPVRSAVGVSGSSSDPKNAPGTGAAAVDDMVLRFIGTEENAMAGPASSRVYFIGSGNQQKRGATAFAATHLSGTTAGTFTFTGSLGEWTAQTVVLRAAPTTQPTAVSDVSGAGTYGSTATLTATLTSGATPLADRSIVFTLGSGTVGAATTNASGIATLSGVSLAGYDAGSYPNEVGAGFAGETAYSASNGSGPLSVAQADADIDVDGFTGTYDGDAHGATGTATGVNTEDLSAGLDLGASFTNVPGGTANWTFEGGTNYVDDSGSVEIVINKADATILVLGTSVTYDGLAHGATGTATGADGSDLSALLDLGASFTDVPGGTANWTFAGDLNHNEDSGSVEILIGKADADIDVDGFTGTYDGDSHGATGTATGVEGEDLSGLLDLGDSFTGVPGGTAEWTFAGNGNYNNASGSVEIEIGKADATIEVLGFTGTYDGDPHGATGTATGVNGEDLSGLLDFGDSFTDVPGGTAEWSFAGNTNYNSDSGTAAIVINKADADIDVDGFTGTYDGDPHGATGTATGVDGEDLSAGFDFGDTFTDVPGGTASWTFEGATNYNDASGTAEILITQAEADIDVDGFAGTYDGEPHGATGTATGVNGEDLSAGLNLGVSFTDVPGGTASWTFEGGTNYQDASGSVEIEIGKATVTGSFSVFDKTYDGTNEATISARNVHGVIGDDVVELVGGTATFDDVNAGLQSVTGVGFAIDGADAGNYELASSTLVTTATILQADADVSVSGTTVTYDGDAHGASGTATGVNGEDLSAGLDLGDSFTDVPGGTANWTFEGGTNYLDESGSVEIVINQAEVTGSFTAANKFWDGTTAATVTSRSLLGVIGLDDVDLVGGTATFASSAIGTWTVTLTGASLSGPDAGNYTLTSVSTTTASILAAYRTEGFFRPVDMTPTTTSLKVWNSIKGGQTVPLKFRVYSAETGAEITSTAGLTVRIIKIQCTSGVLESDDIAPATGSTSLRYDTTEGQFIFNWAVPKGANICYEAYVQTADGATQMAGPGGTPLHDAFFRSK
jgi:hypothetical protein